MYGQEDRGGTRYRVLEFGHKLVIHADVFCHFPVDIHQLDRQIDQLGWRVRRLGGEDILLTKDRRMAFNYQARALVSVTNHRRADNDPLVGF